MATSPQQQTRLAASELLIRRMRVPDVPGIMTIESVSFGRHHWTEESFFNEMNNHVGRYYTMLDTTRNRVAGYCGLWHLLDEVHATTLAVHPELRGNSLGELLWAHLIERCMGQSIKWVTLEVRVTNYNAQSLYYKYGFELVGRRAKYYQDNLEDALIMTTPNILTEEYRKLFNRNKQDLMQRLGGLPEGFGL